MQTNTYLSWLQPMQSKCIQTVVYAWCIFCAECVQSQSNNLSNTLCDSKYGQLFVKNFLAGNMFHNSELLLFGYTEIDDENKLIQFHQHWSRYTKLSRTPRKKKLSHSNRTLFQSHHRSDLIWSYPHKHIAHRLWEGKWHMWEWRKMKKENKTKLI